MHDLSTPAARGSSELHLLMSTVSCKGTGAGNPKVICEVVLAKTQGEGMCKLKNARADLMQAKGPIR